MLSRLFDKFPYVKKSYWSPGPPAKLKRKQLEVGGANIIVS